MAHELLFHGEQELTPEVIDKYVNSFPLEKQGDAIHKGVDKVENEAERSFADFILSITGIAFRE